MSTTYGTALAYDGDSLTIGSGSTPGEEPWRHPLDGALFHFAEGPMFRDGFE